VLGLSLSKILFTIAIVIAVWKGFTLITRLANERQAAVKRRAAAARGAGSRRTGAEQGAIELRECPRCGAYIDPRETCSCGLRGNDARRT
jgi:ribosomal protein L32